MTKKQEESIEYLNESILIYKNTIPKISQAIETVLNMLKEKDSEIERLKQALARNIARNVTASMKESAKSKEDLEMLNAGWQIELEKKDKVIYEMIGSFIDLGFGFEYCNNDDRCINDCDKCIYKHFERKAINNG